MGCLGKSTSEGRTEKKRALAPKSGQTQSRPTASSAACAPGQELDPHKCPDLGPPSPPPLQPDKVGMSTFLSNKSRASLSILSSMEILKCLLPSSLTLSIRKQLHASLDTYLKWPLQPHFPPPGRAVMPTKGISSASPCCQPSKSSPRNNHDVDVRGSESFFLSSSHPRVCSHTLTGT